MAILKIKGVAGKYGDRKLDARELAVDQSYLYYASATPSINSTTLSPIRVAIQDTYENIFTNDNSFRIRSANGFQIQNSSGDLKYYAGTDGLLSTQLTSFTDYNLVNKLYVDGLIQGLDIKASVKIATSSTFAVGSFAGTKLEITSNTGSSGWFIEIDGMQLSVPTNERILYYGTWSAVYNGIWQLDSVTGTGPYTGVFSRTADANTGTELVNAFVFVEAGALADTGWVCTNNSITIGTTSITWTQFSGAGTYNAGTGLTLSGSTFSHLTTDGYKHIPSGGAASQILAYTSAGTAYWYTPNWSTTGHTHSHSLVNLNGTTYANSTATFFAPATGATVGDYPLLSGGTDAAPVWGSTVLGTMAYQPNTGTTSITTLGTITTGTWNATAIGATKGGTGQTVYAIGDLLYASATNSLSKLASVTNGYHLVAKGVGTAPAWEAMPASYTPSTHPIASHTATAWRMFFSNATTTAIQELAFGASNYILKSAGASSTPAWTNPENLTIGTGLTAAGNYNVWTARTISLRMIESGSTYAGALWYDGTGITAGTFNGGVVAPSETTRLNYEGWFYATQFEGIIDGGEWA